MTNITSNGLAIEEPSCAVRVADTGSPLCSVSTADRFGIARMTAAAENITMTPTSSSAKTIAFGTLRSGCSTSSAIEPADSKPRNAQPTNAIATSIVLSVLPEPSGRPWKSVDTGLTRWNSNSTMPSTTEPTISQTMLATIMTLRNCRPIMLAAVPKPMTPIETAASSHRLGESTPNTSRMNPAAA